MPKRKPKADSRGEILKRAASAANYTMKHPILKATFQFTVDGRAWAKADTSVVVERYSLQAIDKLLDGTSTPKPPNQCEEKGCTNPATYGSKNQAKARMCASHKPEAMVIAGCSQCSQKAAVTVNGVVVCLAHAAIEVGKLQATDPPTIVDVLGTRMCACGAVPRFGLENKRSLACGPCARIWGVLLGGVAFACVTGSPGSSARTANACVGSACAEKAKKPVGHNITPSGKRYCATDRDAVITDEAAKDKPFDERTTFKFAPLPCPGKPCTADGCTEESVVVRAADDTAMCLAHWTALDDVEAKKAFEWTGACHKRPIYGPTFDDGNVRGPRERCGDHKLADDVNNHNSRCSVCVAALGWRWATIANRGKCGPCNGGNADQWFPLMRQSLWIGFWQRNVSLAGATITHESREKLLEEDKLSRIDTRVDRADGSVDLIEIDEGAHWDRSVCEELGRLRAVVQIPGKQVRVVRVNPDRPGKQIAAKITRGAVVRLLEEKGGQLTFDDKLAMEEVKKENLERSARLVEEARNVPPGHVVYVDYPLESPHLMVNGRALVRHPDVEIRGEKASMPTSSSCRSSCFFLCE